MISERFKKVFPLTLAIVPQVVQHCVSCLGAIVNKVTHNYKFVWACFNRFYGEAAAGKHFCSSTLYLYK